MGSDRIGKRRGARDTIAKLSNVVAAAEERRGVVVYTHISLPS